VIHRRRDHDNRSCWARTVQHDCDDVGHLAISEPGIRELVDSSVALNMLFESDTNAQRPIQWSSLREVIVQSRWKEAGGGMIAPFARECLGLRFGIPHEVAGQLMGGRFSTCFSALDVPLFCRQSGLCALDDSFLCWSGSSGQIPYLCV
jgi:hypothetical protein